MSPTELTGPMDEALRLMILALEILDREEAPGDVGAHLDLAIQRLRQALAARGANGQPI